MKPAATGAPCRLHPIKSRNRRTARRRFAKIARRAGALTTREDL